MSKSIFVNSILTKKTPIDVIIIDELAEIRKLLNTKFVGFIQNVINHYYLGQFEEMLKLLTKPKLIELTRLVHSYRKNPKIYPTYEKVRALLKLYLEGLTKSITQFLDIVNLKEALKKCEERCSILDDMKKLKEYIDGLNKTINLFAPPPVHVVEAKILPEHATYLRMYGYPVGGIFDPEKLNDIISKQKS
jgi:hypothetical protein